MIVTRFPPSPTGFIHVGSLRTALYNYLFARKHGGKLILRIEDTDQKRYVEGAVKNLLETLKWAGLNYDEGPLLTEKEIGENGPYVQSARAKIYKKHAGELLEKGTAYKCFCEEERLKKMREEQIAKKIPPKYDRRCLNLPRGAEPKGAPFVIRQKIPYEKTIKFHDHIRGEISFHTSDIDDQVLMKSDGLPTYHLANVVDDHLMGVTHVIRGEEWLSSTPKHILLYEAFGWKAPDFAHIPLLLDKDRKKLSKRMGHVSVEEYRKEGYLPEAVLNFVALLGWHPGKTDQEIFTMPELIELFSLEKVHKSGAIFDREKLDWMNWQWRKRKFLEALPEDSADHGVHERFMNAKTEALRKMTDDFLPSEWKKDLGKLSRALLAVEEKILQNPSNIKEHICFFFEEFPEIDKNILYNEKMKVDKETAKKTLEAAKKALEAWSDFSDHEALKEPLQKAVGELGVKRGQVFWPVRVALTNQQFSPGVFEVIWILGKNETIKKLTKAIRELL